MARPIPRGSVCRAAAVLVVVAACLLSGGAVALASAGPVGEAATLAGAGGAQQVPMALPTSCPNAFENCAFLSITTTGTGGGTTTTAADQGGLDCSYSSGGTQAGTCYAPVQWSANQSSLFVTMTLTPNQGSYACVTGVSCAGEGATMRYQFSLAPNETKIVNLEYDISLHRLTIELQGGTGVVSVGSTTCTSSPCDGGLFPWGSDVQLKAAAVGSSTFLGWTGACATQPATCTLTITADTLTTAVFSGGPTPAPTTAPTATPKPTPGPTHTPKPTTAPASAAASAGMATSPSPAPSASDGGAPSDSTAPVASPSDQAAVIPDSPSPAALVIGQAAAASSDGGVPWLPILAVVIVVAIAVNLLAFQVMRGRRRPGA